MFWEIDEVCSSMFLFAAMCQCTTTSGKLSLTACDWCCGDAVFTKTLACDSGHAVFIIGASCCSGSMLSRTTMCNSGDAFVFLKFVLRVVVVQ